MALFNKKKHHEISDKAKTSVENLCIKMEFSVLTKEQYSPKTIASIVLEKALISDTDTEVKDILDEVESIIENTFNDVSEQVSLSKHLSDGYHKSIKDKKNPETDW